MRKLYFLAGLFLCGYLNAQVITFPDVNFKNALTGISSNNFYYYTAKDAAGNYTTIDTNFNQQIEVSEALTVYELSIHYSNSSWPFITSVAGIEQFTNLRYINIDEQRVTALNLSGMNNLVEVIASENLITSVDIAGLTSLQKFNIFNNQLTSLNLIGLPNLKELDCSYNQIMTINASALPNLEKLNVKSNDLATLNVIGLSNLKELDCSENNLSALDLTGLGNLTLLHAISNDLTNINLSPCGNLIELNLGQNQFTALNVSALVHLETFGCSYNELTAIDISNLSNLKYLYCNDNPLTSLDASGLSNLFEIRCENASLTTIDVSGCSNIYEMKCSNNQLLTLDMSDCKNLYRFDCSYNILTSLFLKNGATTNYYTHFNDNYDLTYICADEEEIPALYGLMYQEAQYPNPANVMINSYCSFTPGGQFYVIKGHQKFDINNNGCDGSGSVYPNLKFSITDGVISGNLISNATGDYSIPVSAGKHSFKRFLETPSYFTVSPPSVTVNFPTESSPFTQNFCITPNGVHQDLQVRIFPIIPARPGADATYKILFKNKGTVTLSGNVQLRFEDAKLDFVSANPGIVSQTENILAWNFSNLQSLEEREIQVVLNINSQQEIPAVNVNDQLNFVAEITPLTVEEMPQDNIFGFKQIVVGSIDPNDKMCLQGNIVSPEVIGEYVHYQIRFENTGTFPAENIVVKDIVDTTKFEISTLEALSGSHPFITKISAGNKVEFIFENIQLPFDNANNDGFVIFKIKTKSSLFVGDTFSNQAGIYFDYDFPVITNNAVSVIQTLGKTDFEFSNHFTLYPNPANQILHIKTNQVEMKSIAIYNILGQIMISIPIARDISSIDVSNLKTGSYFIKINSDKGTTNAKFVKN